MFTFFILVITATCGKLVTFNFKRNSTSSGSLGSRSSNHQVTQSSQGSGSSQSMLSVSSVDSEVVELQSRLVFARGISVSFNNHKHLLMKGPLNTNPVQCVNV